MLLHISSSFLISMFACVLHVWWEPIIIVWTLTVDCVCITQIGGRDITSIVLSTVSFFYSTSPWMASPASAMQSGEWELVHLQECLLLFSRIPWMLSGLDWLCSHRQTKCTEVGRCDCPLQQHNTMQHNNLLQSHAPPIHSLVPSPSQAPLLGGEGPGNEATPIQWSTYTLLIFTLKELSMGWWL